MRQQKQNLTELLILATRGDQDAAAQVIPIIYDKLHRLASERTRQEGGRNKWAGLLSPTELVHEAYMSLMNGSMALEWNNRRHFFAMAAITMRRIALDSLRYERRAKRGEGWERIPLSEAALRKGTRPPKFDPLELAEVLQRLAAHHPRQAIIAEWRVFVGLPHAHIARLLGISQRLVEAEWAKARAFLAKELSEHQD